MGRILGVVAICWFAWLGGAFSRADAQDGGKADVRQASNARRAQANVEGAVSVSDARLKSLDLPALAQVELTTLPKEQLALLDDRITQVREQMQQGRACEGIRAASRVPLRVWVWEKHQRELFTAAGLFLLSLIVGFAWSGRIMRTVMPVAPFAGAAFLAYVAVTRAQEAEGDLHSGLRACSADLPESRPEQVTTVKQRLAAAAEFEAEIERVAQGRQSLLLAAVERDHR